MSGNSVQFNNDFYKIANIVNSWLADNDLPEQWYPKVLSWGLKALRKISIDRWQEPKSILLEVDARHTATCPADYVRWTKVAIKIGQYYKTLAVNPEMHQLVRTESDDVVSTLPLYQMPNGLDFANYSGYNFFNYGGSTLFSVGGGLPSKGHFQVVNRGDTTWEITFDYDVRVGTQIIMEYISDGLNPNEESVVDPMLADYIETALDFKYEEKFNPTRTEASIHRMGVKLWDAEVLVAARKSNLDMKTMQTISRREARFTTKL